MDLMDADGRGEKGRTVHVLVRDTYLAHRDYNGKYTSPWEAVGTDRPTHCLIFL